MTQIYTSTCLASVAVVTRNNSRCYSACCDCSARIYRRPGFSAFKKRCDNCAETQRRRVLAKSLRKTRAKNADVGHVAALLGLGGRHRLDQEALQRMRPSPAPHRP